MIHPQILKELKHGIRSKRGVFAYIILITFITLTACELTPENWIMGGDEVKFDHMRAYQDVIYQVSLGPRTIGSQAHATVVNWIFSELEQTDWDPYLQVGKWNENQITNIIGRRGRGSPWIIIGVHYDSRFIADKDLNREKRNQPVLGANDGASGVAVLLELARTIPVNLAKQVWLVFFDAEDNGNIQGWEWSIGSSLFVNNLEDSPDAVLILDMIGDKDLNIYREKYSDTNITNQIWKQAKLLQYPQFIDEYNHRVIDDHIPFLQQAIPAALIIDLDYPYWHTTEDNVEKVSPESLAIVGNVVLAWLIDD